MAAEQGIVSPVADMDSLAAVDAAWVSAIKALSPKLTHVRVSFSADKQGNYDINLLKRGLQAFKDGGLDVRAVLELNLGPVATANPNAQLGYQGDVFKNPFIDAYTDSCIELLDNLGPLCPSTVWITNEQNLQGAANPLGSGQVIPALALGETADPSKPGAMAPEAAWSLYWHAAWWIKKECKRVTTIYPGAMSCDAAFLTSMYDGWIGQWLDQGIKYLTDNGIAAAWPWDGLSLNVEGVVASTYARYIASGMAAHKTRVAKGQPNIIGPTVISEWGVPNSSPGKPINELGMHQTAQALSGMCAAMAFYAAQDDGGYGCLVRGLKDGEIIPVSTLEWAGLLPKVLP